MNKRNTITAGAAFLIIVLMLSITFFTRDSSAANYDWGTEYVKVKKSIPPQDKSEQFNPNEKPNYKNKILSYITAIDNKLMEKIIVLRVQSQPETDYLFVNNKLYTIMENWGSITAATEKELKTQLSGKYGQPQVQKDNNFYIYSFNNIDTKVLLYLKKTPGGTSKCKVYYYAKKLFRMLIME